ncbi:MAG: S-layer homology domain-containing protein [Thermoanaerobaculaceae bacterium]
MSHCLDLRWNAHYTSDASLRASLNSKQYGDDWEGTQTVAPAGAATGAPTFASLTVQWSPIAYTADPGGYRIWARPGASGPCQAVGMTVDKSASSLVVTGLAPASTNSFQVQTVTNPHTGNTNTVSSELSPAVNGATAGSLSPAQSVADTYVGRGLVSDVNGVLEPGETVEVAPAWRNGGAVSLAPHGTASSPMGPAGATYSIGDPSAAFGTVAAGATADCHASTGTCHAIGVSAPAARPVPHWDVEWTETLTTGETFTRTTRVGDSFTDVARSHWAYRSVETIFHNNVTAGCSAEPFSYCPGTTLTRAQMAVLLLMAEHGTDHVPLSTGSVFSDVPVDHWAGDWIEALAGEGITSGRAPSLYCPTGVVTGAEMAVSLTATFGLELNR